MALQELAQKAPAVVTALASEVSTSGFDVTSVMQSSVDTTKAQMFTVLGIVVPAIVAVVAAVVAVKFGISWLKKIRA